MNIVEYKAKSILTEQGGGFLANGGTPFTHTLNAYTGCSFGATSCGTYCYAQMMPNWLYGHGTTDKWGHAVDVKSNAPDLLRKSLIAMGSEKRNSLRIFMSTTTDPYQPLESRYRLTEAILEVFAEFPDLGLLVIQTRSNLVCRDMPIIRKIPYAWVSMTIETDDQALLHTLAPGGIPIAKRFEAIRKLRKHDIPVQIAVSPCLPYTTAFAGALIASGANRIIVDSLVDGDGQKGGRTAKSPFGKRKLSFNWRDDSHAKVLFSVLNRENMLKDYTTGWSSDGFAGIPSIKHVKQKRLF